MRASSLMDSNKTCQAVSELEELLAWGLWLTFVFIHLALGVVRNLSEI